MCRIFADFFKNKIFLVKKKLWRTIKAIDGKSKPTVENEALVFNRKHIYHRNTSPTVSTNSSPHQSCKYTLLHTKPDICQGKQERKSVEMAPTFTTAMVTSAIRAAATAEPLDLICSASST